ncbi:MAG: polyprenyl synthetase family protein, partial [Treponema sp.]|nr:polyprenyl synthetase family protein [Treponema sp.]
MGPTTAVLVGDYWLAKAVSLIIGTGHQLEVTTLFSRTLSDLAEGEMLQLQKSGEADTTEEDYLRIVFCKTASLFEATCVSAALSVDAPEERREAARRYAVATGVAFQIRDDIFDYWDEANIGKPVGIDLKEQKITMPLLGALRNSVPSERERIRRMILDIPRHPEHCAWIHRYVLDNGGVEYASDRLNEYIDEALDALKQLPASEDRDVLEKLVKYNAVRKK